LDIDIDAFSIYEEFKNYDDLIGIYVFTVNRKYEFKNFHFLPFP